MARRGATFDLHELQRELLEEDIREEEKHGIPPAPATRGSGRGVSKARPARGPVMSGRGAPLPMAAHSGRAPPPSLRGGPKGGPPPEMIPGLQRRGLPPMLPVPMSREKLLGPPTSEPAWDVYAEGAPASAIGEPAAPVRSSAERGLGLDVHELLKQEALAPDASSNCDPRYGKNRPCPTDIYGISDQYVVLDSFNKVQNSLPEKGEFHWNFMVQGTTGNHVIGVRDIIDTVIEMQITSFPMPILEEIEYKLAPAPAVTPSGTNQVVLVHNNNNGVAGAPTLITNVAPYGQYPSDVLVPAATFLHPWINNPYTQLPFGNRFTIQYREAGNQSFSDFDGARHHFEFVATHPSKVGINPNMLVATPTNGALWDSFVFTDPLMDVHGMTLIFRGVDSPIKFQPDVLYNITIVSDGAAAPGPFLQFQAPNHRLRVGDRIFIGGFAKGTDPLGVFSSGIPNLDTYINRAEGHVVSGDPSVAALAPGTLLATAGFPDVFWLDPAVSIIDLSPAPALPLTASVYIAKRRLLIPIRLRRVVSRLTNYIAP